MDKYPGLYIHIPFCIKKCLYCDFVSYTNCDALFDSYIDAVIKESEQYRETVAETVFVGGGTPTVLSATQLKRLICGIRKNISLTDDAEFTFEANPKTLTEEKCKTLAECGVNRLSIGVQSFSDTELKLLGRVHDSECAKATLKLASVYFKNINADIMTSLPGQTYESVIKSISEAINCGITHLSCYSLIIEENTPFYEMYSSGTLKEADEDDDRKIYSAASEFLAKNGFEKYEISNFAKPGFKCRHNIKYWTTNEYIGLGCAAHSYLDGTRYENTTSLEEYIKNPCVHKNKTNLSTDDKISEYNMMCLRTMKGIETKEFYERFAIDFDKMFERQLKKYTSAGFIKKTDTGYALTNKGIDVSNAVMCEFII